MRRLTIMAVAMAMLCMCMAQGALAADGDRMYYVAIGKLTEKMHDPANMGLLSQHIEYLGKLYDNGHLLMAGPFTDDSGEGVIILSAASLDEARQLLMADPSIAGGIIEPVSVQPLFAAFSRPDNHRFTMEEMSAMMSSMPPAGGDSAPSAGSASSSASSTNASSGSADASMEMKPGGVNFTQIPTSDAAASSAFYKSLFGWDIEAMDADGMHMTFFTAPGGMMGEFSSMLKPAAPMSGPIIFINTPSVKDLLPKVTAAGGQVYQQEMPLPENWGHIAIIGDSSGNAVGIWSTGE